MTGTAIAQPDITLLLDNKGVIRNATLSNGVSEENFAAWVGRPWVETIDLQEGGDVQRLVDNARSEGVAVFHKIAQRFPSGRELPMEYTAVRIGGDGALLAIGKSLLAVTELQARLIAAQHAMERDYWRLREIETRSRLLFDTSNEAVLVIRASDLRIIEANPAAIHALGITPTGRGLLEEVASQDHEAMRTMLAQAREYGRAPGALIHLGAERRPSLIRASLLTSEPGPAFLLQLSPAAGGPPAVPREPGAGVDELVDRLPDGFVVVDQAGTVVWTNQSFVDLVQLGAKGAVLGEKLRRWLRQPGADFPVLAENLRLNGSVRLFTTTLEGELGSEIDVEIAATVDAQPRTRRFAILIRDVSQRLPNPATAGRLEAVIGALGQQLGTTPLRALVSELVGAVERHYVEAALERTGGNRTAAAELLGLSRQSLYAKLDRYGLAGEADQHST